MLPNRKVVEAVFVYGSLRRGEKYRYLIEREVVKEEAATLPGRMFHFSASPGGLGDFPYITPGDRQIQGELLRFADLGRALEILDELEDSPDLYLREVLTVTLASGETERAYVYRIAEGRETAGREVLSGDWKQRFFEIDGNKPGREES